MTSIEKLKQQRKAKREAPPSIDEQSNIIGGDPRDQETGVPPPPTELKEPLKALSFKLPESVVKEFGELAYGAFGATHGAKQQLMLRMIEHYKAALNEGGGRARERDAVAGRRSRFSQK